ncbi:MAG: DUF4864 domain-containing protein [Pseudomonadota bacterium]
MLEYHRGVPDDHSVVSVSQSQEAERKRAYARSIADDASSVRLMQVVFASLVAFALLAFAAATSGWAQSTEDNQPALVPEATVEQMQTVIRAQIEAFRAEDAETAYSYASAPIKLRFPTAAMFVSMVQQGYPAVYSAQSYSFGDAALTPRGPAQRVELVAGDGQVWRGLYTFSENSEGDLRISGVFLLPENERQI